MGRWVIIFCALVVLVGVFLFGEPQGGVAWILRAMLFLFVALAVVTLAAGRGQTTDQPPA